MTDEELVEKVARAMFPYSIYHGYDDETKQRLWINGQGILKTYARAAIPVVILAMTRSRVDGARPIEGRGLMYQAHQARDGLK